jgi:maltose alpha-D-glucosyltransferase / alpha-amylase
MEQHWYKEAIIYELHVKCFYDSSSDGVGDFKGLTQKLDYLQDLGITAIWLLPFYPSPLKDDGYDISDYTNVHTAYGNLRDFKEFLRQAHHRGLKVITELVINHTSDQHPWFQRSRKAKKGSRMRDFYVWSDTWEKYNDARIIFQDFEKSNWTWDHEAQSYFWHRFYSHQPDLNFDHEEVHKAIFKKLSFWFQLGVDGMRLDAIPYLYEREGTNCENLPETHLFLKKLRNYVDTHFENRMLLAEANQWPEDAAKYFGVGDECHMAFHFPVMPRLFMSIHLEDSLPITEIMTQTPDIPTVCQWALFLRNHDELTLEMVTDEERDYMFRVYAFDQQARLNLGIRRRLAPLLKNDRRKIELMNVLLFSLSGTPVLYYGDELGMGDNIYLGDRNGVRTPMQWSSDRNAGFSRSNPQQLYLPPIIDPEYHYETVNVEAQLTNPHSLLWWTKQLISLRKRYKAFGYGNTIFIPVENRKVLVFSREYGAELILIIANLSRFPQYVELDLKAFNGYSVIEMFSGERFPSIGELPYFLTLGAYGYYWFSLEKQPVEEILLEVERKKEKQVAELSYKMELEKIFQKGQRSLLEGLVKKYLSKRHSYTSILPHLNKAKVAISDHFTLDKSSKLHLLVIEITSAHGVSNLVPLYVRIFDAEQAKALMDSSSENVIISIGSQAGKKKILYDMRNEPALNDFLYQFVERQKKQRSEKSELHGIKIRSLKEGVLKIPLATDEGLDPNIELRLFLNKQKDFKDYVPLLGYLEYVNAPNTAIAYVERADPIHEYSAKNAFVEAADRFLQRMETSQESISEDILLPKVSLVKLATGKIDPKVQDLLEEFPEVARLLGETIADFHHAMYKEKKDPNFTGVEYTLFYQRSLYQTMRTKINEPFFRLKKTEGFKDWISLHKRMLGCMDFLTKHKFQIARFRHHGNFILQNLAYTGKEFLILNFGSSPMLTQAEKRYKRSCVRDLAAMFFSIAEAGFEGVQKLHARGLVKDWEVACERAFVWSLWIGSAFLRSYLRKVSEASFFSKDPQEIDYLAGMFLLEKAAEILADPKTTSFEVPCRLLSYWIPIYEEFKFS